MVKIKNPIIPGMAPEPSIIRVENTYYLATSTFHWMPGIQLYKSTDLVNWTLIDNVLKKDKINLQGTNTPGGIWAPHLSYDIETKKYWLAYSHMVNMAGREFSSNSYMMWSENISGPWSEPIYLTSIGFDPSLFHDEDGRHYAAILEWESREGYQSPGHIVIAEISLENGEVLGQWKRVTQGFTTRGCAEAPQIYKHAGYYYLLLASGGTGYAHGVEIGRSKSIMGPYEPHPTGEPIITSSPRHLFSLGDPDAGHFEMYNPNSLIQKAGHGSLVDTPTGEWYITHLMSRPLPGTLLNPLGRETSIQKMRWNDDNWLEMEDGSNLAKIEVEGISGIEDLKLLNHDVQEYFEAPKYSNQFMTPYQAQTIEWVNTTERPGFLRIYGGDSFFSQVNPSIMATRATSFLYEIDTKVIFNPNHYSETAGVGLYYDSNNWVYLHITYSEITKGPVLSVLQAKLGERKEIFQPIIEVPSGTVELKIIYNMGFAEMYFRLVDQEEWQLVMEKIDVTYLSDEGVNGESGEIGGFTGLFNFIGTVDAHQHDSFADFQFYKVVNFE
ncbi:Beta-1,4-xylosidase [Lactococcus cremoris subsp. cremoris UC509.9]|uniref:Family 43 glycosylhydrolase n=1 Tax=Lactococcus lactis subsp. cremoris TaxID=1359 RepID=A0AAJ6MIS4_LACLC|nr:family 43 glycosylhydrolase [Lactococcus cremoris]AFW91716.1 Beta-1,4-xylosidase [Lactococcus cremoris subsp. cremoris UC509.9]ARD91424.1 family 43 glycosylhydrolase [Lactococcus cremoris]MRM69390.1 family 43 glycosylhydrolase [Lactococcus cremoris]QJD19981.1 glycoside hydrolase family 43 protein [Lactococcus cremoris]QRZ29938.1 Beta-1-4-xylosidase [Lactococcus cremoris]